MVKISSHCWQQTGRSIIGESEPWPPPLHPSPAVGEKNSNNKLTLISRTLNSSTQINLISMQGRLSRILFFYTSKKFCVSNYVIHHCSPPPIMSLTTPKTQPCFLHRGLFPLPRIFSPSEFLHGLYSKSYTPALWYFVLCFHCCLQVNFIFPESRLFSFFISFHRV